MKTVLASLRATRGLIGLLTATVLTLFAAASMFEASAQGYRQGDLKIEQPWTRATPAGAKVAGGFMKITNTGTAPDRLIGGSAVGSGRFEIHETRLDGNVMRMRHLDVGLDIAPGQTVELRPGSYHVMLMDLTGGFKEGERVKGTLVFERAGTVEIEFKVEPIGSSGGQGHNH